MSDHYPKLLQQEKRRGLAFVWSIVICLFTPFALLLIFAKDWSNFAGGIALGIILATIAGKLVRKLVNVTCPLCGSNNMRENYYGGRNSQDVAHVCEGCGAHFDNGTLQEA